MKTVALQAALDRSGYKTTFIANRLGISRQALLHKVQGQTEFKASEVQTLIPLLHLNKDEVMDIFFESK